MTILFNEIGMFEFLKLYRGALDVPEINRWNFFIKFRIADSVTGDNLAVL